MPKCSNSCNKKGCIFFKKAEIPAVVANDDITPPQNGDFCNMLVVYQATGNAYLFASDGIPTLLSANDYRRLNHLPSINGVTVIGDLTLSDIGVTQLVEEEADARRGADNDLQEQIDTIAASSDVVDIVGTYRELMQYDTSHLTINDVIKVIDDETENDATTYYRWTNDGWLFIGQEGPYYTKSQVNELLDGKLDDDALDDYYDKAETDALLADKADVSDLAAKQDKLIAGTNITIDQATSTISATVPSLANYYTKQETYSQTEVNNLISDVEADIPTATSQLTNDSGFLTTLPIATSQILGGVKVGSGLSVASDGTLSATGTSITVDSALSTTSTNPVENRVITNALNNKANLSDIPTVPTNVSAFYNDAGYVTSSTIAQNYYNKTETYTQTEVDNLISSVSADIPTKTSDLTNDGANGTSTYVELSQLATVATSGSYNDLADKPTIMSGLVEMSYGESNAWAKFIAAYQAKQIVYCRASSAANPASGSQTRKAFMAYVNNADNPTEVEFQYVRSVSSKTASQPVDQVFVYKLTSASGGTWTVQTRDMGPKLAQGTNTTVSYSNDTYTISATQPTVPTKTSDLTNDGSDGTSTYVEADQLATVATSGSYNDLSNKPTIPAAQVNSDWNATSGKAQILNKPTKLSQFTNDSGFITGYTETDPIYSASPAAGITAEDIESWGNKSDFSGSYNDLTNKPTIGNATLTIQKNGTSAGTFTANATSNKTINITVPTTAADVSALPASTKYGASIAVSINTTDYKVTTTLKDQDGNTLGTAQVIDLPLESVVVNGSYDSTNKKIVLTLQSGSTIDIPVADLVAGLQSEITSTNKLSSDLVDDTNHTHKFMTSAEKTKLSGIAAGAEVNVQSDWNQATTTADDYIKNKPALATVATSGSYNDLSNKPTIPTVNNATLTIQKNGTTVNTFTANASSNVTANISVPTKTSELTNDSSFVTSSGTVAKADQLTTARTIAISGGAVGTATSFNGTSDISIPVTYVRDAYTIWGGKDIVTDISPDDAGCIDEFGHNKLAFLPAECIEVKYSTDGGTTWTDYGLTDAQKVAMVTTTGPSVYAGKSATITADNIANMRGRVRIACGTMAKSSKIYTALKKILINFSTSGATNTKIRMRRRTIANYLSGTETWEDLGTHNIGGWSGWNSYAYNGNFGGNMTNQTGQPGQIEFEFWGETFNSSYSSRCSLIDIRFIGTTNWTTPSELSRAGHLYTMDVSKNATFPANVNVTGSLGHGSYTYTLPNKNGTVAMTSDIPSVPTVNNGQLTIQKNGSNVATFTANASSNVTANISVPTKTSDLVNDGSDNTAQYLETDETAYKTASIPYGQCDGTSTSTVFTATVPGITELRDGVCMWLKNGVVTSASGFTININNLGAKPVYNNMAAATRDTTIWNINYTMLFVYDSTRVEGGCWMLYRGYNSDNNTIGYQVRTNSSTLPMKSATYRYRLLFTSGDGKNFVPATNSTSSNATDSRTVCQDKINPFGSIFYYGSTATVAANSRPGASSLWQQYAISLGYSFNRTGAALTLTQWKPVYVKAAPQTDGSAIIDSTTPYVQDLPTTDDGKIYIFLGVAYSATNIELLYNHPVYYYKDGMIRLWTADIAVPTKTSDLTNDGADGGSPYVTEADIAPAELGGEGNAIHIEGTTDCSAIDTAILGNIEQDGTPIPSAPVPIQTVTGRQTVTTMGKNILDYVTYFRSGTYNGITATLNDDGSITISGKPTSNYVQIVAVHDITGMLEDGATYSLSSDGHDRRFIGQFQRRPKNGGGTQYIDTITGNKTVTIDKTNNNYFIGVMTVTTTDWGNDPLTITRTFQFEKGPATSFEPFKGQAHEINLGKNLIEPLMPTTTYNGVTCTNNGDGSFTLNGTATATATWRIEQSTGGGHDNLKPLNGTYTLSCKGVQAGVSLVVTQYNVWQIIGRVQNNETPSTFTTNLNDTLVYIAVTNGTTVNNVTVYPQLEKGSTASSYSAYFEPIELCKIGTYQDRIYKENGKWWLEKQTGKVVLNGSEDWRKSGNTQVDRYWYNIYSGDVVPAFHQIYSDKFFYEYNVPTVNAMWVDVYQTLERLFVNFATYNTTTVTDLKTWLASNPTTVYYPLATPITTEITDETLIRQLEALAGALGYDGVTNIISTSPGLPAILSVSTYTGSAIPSATRARAGIVRIGDGIDVDDCGTISVNAQKAPTAFTMQYADNLAGWQSGDNYELVKETTSSPTDYIYRANKFYYGGADVSFLNEKTGVTFTPQELYAWLLDGNEAVLNHVPLGWALDNGAEALYAGNYIDGIWLKREAIASQSGNMISFNGSAFVTTLIPRTSSYEETAQDTLGIAISGYEDDGTMVYDLISIDGFSLYGSVQESSPII